MEFGKRKPSPRKIWMVDFMVESFRYGQLTEFLGLLSTWHRADPITAARHGRFYAFFFPKLDV